MEKDTPGTSGNTAFRKYIIGIGASAGGMDAIHRLFDHMPENTGFSFVVIQHLSPDHKSLLSELLAKHTKMTVVEATDGMAAESDSIYVIPSGKVMTIQDGRLSLSEKEAYYPSKRNLIQFLLRHKSIEFASVAFHNIV